MSPSRRRTSLSVLWALLVSIALGVSALWGAAAPDDWPQLGHDPQRTNFTAVQVDPPYCFVWKWYEVPIASRAQPVVADGRLFVGGMDGALHARAAATGAPLWRFQTGGPIRHGAGVAGTTVVFGSHDGGTYAVDAPSGALRWQTPMGRTETAPLLDPANSRVVVAASSGVLTALHLSDGAVLWQYDAAAPILTSPSLSVDGTTVFAASEAIVAFAVRAAGGASSAGAHHCRARASPTATRWSATTPSCIARSRSTSSTTCCMAATAPWTSRARSTRTGRRIGPPCGRGSRPNLTNEPTRQSFFALDVTTGASRGVMPVLWTYGNGDIPNVPVLANGGAYVTYRARHGIQTDGGVVHVSTQYDAELGFMNLTTFDIVGLRQANYPTYNAEFRMTSDEPAMLTMGGNILWVDNWERLGGLDAASGALIHVGPVSNDWPECGGGGGPSSPYPVFPLSGNPADPAYPFPSPRVTDGHQRGGLVIANNMLYWRFIEGGLSVSPTAPAARARRRWCGRPHPARRRRPRHRCRHRHTLSPSMSPSTSPRRSPTRQAISWRGCAPRSPQSSAPAGT